jgi:hypothetical protein
MEGSPSDPNGGSLVRANRDGTFTTVVDKLDRPTSMEIVGDTAYVVMLSGEVWKVSNLSGSRSDNRVGEEDDRDRGGHSSWPSPFFDDCDGSHRALIS